MDLHFLGGATTVTGSRFLLTTSRAKVLVDCGMFQGSPNEAVRNRIPIGFAAGELDAILLTHAHLDHCGLLPIAVREGFAGPIHATPGTIELATLVLLDSGRLNEEFAKRGARWERRHPDDAAAEDKEAEANYRAAVDEAARGDAGVAEATAVEQAQGSWSEQPGLTLVDPEADLRNQPPNLNVDLDEPLYTEDDAKAVLPLFSPLDYDREVEVAPGIHATYMDAGHILGSAIIRLRVRDGDGPERIVVFSGDLGRPGTPIIRDPTPVDRADYVVVESTYGGREHEPHEEAIRVLVETIRLVDQSKGVLLVPSFAIGRTQEIVWELDRLIERGQIPLLPLYLDSPMASKASDIYRRYPQYYDEETRKLLDSQATPLDYPDQRIVNKAKDSEAIHRAPRPYMIVASNGMLTGGRVVNHLRKLIDDPGAVLLFVGYQGEGTLGAHIQAGARTVKLDGNDRDVRCQVRSISGFSAHADESEILEWLSHFRAGAPRRVFLVHGDPEAQILLEPKVRALGFEAHIPHWHERVTLD
jgi:metallo-beta-lactamase family protein